jgi:hypothetical protein
MKRLILLLAILAATPAHAVDADYVVFDRSKVAALLHQCSRSTPPVGEAGWTPLAGDILAMEAALPSVLIEQIRHRPAFASAPHGWIRQYVGIVRGGKRLIYGNFVPKSADGDDGRWRREPIIVCDGGEAFFGAEYDVVAKTFTHVAFNGAL